VKNRLGGDGSVIELLSGNRCRVRWDAKEGDHRLTQDLPTTVEYFADLSLLEPYPEG
jgi:hypothetical protein